MKFANIIGHQEVKQHFRQMVAQGRIPHAQLLCGREGIGKLRMAIACAQYISCTNRHDGDSCGVCPSCIKYEKLTHPDLHFVFPIVKSETVAVCDDMVIQFRKMVLDNVYFGLDEWLDFGFGDAKKQSWIYNGESAKIIHKLNLKTFESDYKIMIMWLPERMDSKDECANKILKILEEPPEKTVFFLVSNQPNLLLSTIVSRTQPINFLPLQQEETILALKENSPTALSDEQLQRIARIAGGSALQALRLAKEEEEVNLNLERFITLFRSAWVLGIGRVKIETKFQTLQTLRTWAEELASSLGREGQKKFLAYAQRLLRENFVMNLKNPQLNYLREQEEEFSTNFCRFITERNVEPMMHEFSLAEQHIERNGNARIIFFDMALKTAMLLKEDFGFYDYH